MKAKQKLALILDDVKYTDHINEYETLFLRNNLKLYSIITEYENFFIRKIRKIKYIGIPLQHILYWIKSLKYATNMRNKYDVVICINLIVALFLGFFNKKQKTRIIMCGLIFEEKKNKVYEQIRKKFCLKCFKGIEKIIVHSSKEVPYYTRYFGVDKFVFIKYGIDYVENMHYKNKFASGYFFSGGGSNRDYKTLYKLYEKYENALNFPLYIATNSCIIGSIHHKQIKVLVDVVLEIFWNLLKHSKALILSLKDVEISAGHMVLLQALKYNVPIIVNDIPSIRDYVDENQVVFYISGDVDDLFDKLNTFDTKASTNDFYKKNYTFDKFHKRLIPLISNRSGIS